MILLTVFGSLQCEIVIVIRAMNGEEKIVLMLTDGILCF